MTTTTTFKKTEPIKQRINPIARSRRLTPLLLFCLLPLIAVASDLELEWDGIPLEITLEVGVERFVHFPQAVDVGVTTALAEVLRVQSIDDTVYFTATIPFDSQRVLVRSREGSKVIILELKAQDKPVSSEHVYIAFADKDREEIRNEAYSYGDLVRFAAQHFYAPKRLRTTTEKIQRVGISQKLSRLVRHESIKVISASSWKTETGTYVTGVVIKNTANFAIELNPHMLRGQWLASCFHHYRLLPKNTEANVTVVYLISDTDVDSVLGR